jgi:CYTH domain-containing protein
VGTEIERKFLLAEEPDWLAACDSDDVEQGYLAIEPGTGAEVRLRRIAGARFLTVKQGSGLTRAENEIELSAGQFEALWPLTEGRRIAKTRYRVPHDGATIEVDVFRGALAGIRTAEVEFESEAASAEFDPPAWVGRDVTDDPRYANETLAIEGLPEEGENG